jgi:ADP-ribose pyrophosphatase YjhB (NUDIX family)
MREHTMADDQWIPEDEYQRICARVPIVCVDLLPIVEGGFGLIRRDTYSGMMGLNLIGGSVLIDEPLEGALKRHVLATLGPKASLLTATLVQVGVYQYFRDKRVGKLHDPRKNAVSITYVGEVIGDFIASGEAHEFCIYPLEEPPPLPDFGFGQGVVAYDCLALARKMKR